MAADSKAEDAADADVPSLIDVTSLVSRAFAAESSAVVSFSREFYFSLISKG